MLKTLKGHPEECATCDLPSRICAMIADGRHTLQSVVVVRMDMTNAQDKSISAKSNSLFRLWSKESAMKNRIQYNDVSTCWDLEKMWNDQSTVRLQSQSHWQSHWESLSVLRSMDGRFSTLLTMESIDVPAKEKLHEETCRGLRPTLANPILANPFLANPFFCVLLWLVLVVFACLLCVVLLLCCCCVVVVLLLCCCCCCCGCVCVCGCVQGLSGPIGPPGLAHDSPRTPTVHIWGPRRFKTPPKFHEKTNKRGRKDRILWREREKTARNFGHPPFGPPPFGPHPWARPTLASSTLANFGPTRKLVKKTEKNNIKTKK